MSNNTASSAAGRQPPDDEFEKSDEEPTQSEVEDSSDDEEAPDEEDAFDDELVSEDDTNKKTTQIKRCQFVRGKKPGDPSELVIEPFLLTGNAKKDLYLALDAAGIVDQPVRPEPENTEEGQDQRQEEDDVLAAKAAKLRARNFKWSRPAARAVSECVKAAGEIPTDALLHAQDRLDMPKARHHRFHGPATDEKKLWDIYQYLLYSEYPGGQSGWVENVDKFMWKTWEQAKKAFQAKKEQEKHDRKEKELAKQRADVKRSAKAAPGAAKRSGGKSKKSKHNSKRAAATASAKAAGAGSASPTDTSTSGEGAHRQSPAPSENPAAATAYASKPMSHSFAAPAPTPFPPFGNGSNGGGFAHGGPGSYTSPHGHPMSGFGAPYYPTNPPPQAVSEAEQAARDQLYLTKYGLTESQYEWAKNSNFKPEEYYFVLHKKKWTPSP